MAKWEVEVSGSHTILVVRRRTRFPSGQDLARDESGKIIWFVDREEAQSHADRLNTPTGGGSHG